MFGSIFQINYPHTFIFISFISLVMPFNTVNPLILEYGKYRKSGTRYSGIRYLHLKHFTRARHGFRQCCAACARRACRLQRVMQAQRLLSFLRAQIGVPAGHCQAVQLAPRVHRQDADGEVQRAHHLTDREQLHMDMVCDIENINGYGCYTQLSSQIKYMSNRQFPANLPIPEKPIFDTYTRF